MIYHVFHEVRMDSELSELWTAFNIARHISVSDDIHFANEIMWNRSVPTMICIKEYWR